MIENKYYKINYNLNGGEMNSLVFKGFEFMHQHDEFWNGTSPLLFPIVGRLNNNETLISGKKYQMNGHGFLRNSIFKLKEKGQNFVKLNYIYNQETLKMYPYKFNFNVIYKLVDDYIVQKYEITNLDDKIMPFNFGTHPAFNIFDDIIKHRITFEKEENFISPIVVEDKKILDFKKGNIFKNIKKLDLNNQLFIDDAVIINNVKSKKVVLEGPRFMIYYTFSDFESFAVWTKINSKFICLEAWQGYADEVDTKCFLDKKQLIKLEPNQTKVFETKIKIYDKLDKYQG